MQEGRVTVDLTDDSGTVLTPEVELNPASRVELLGGTEVIANERDGTRTAVDFQLGFRYHTWEDVPSGMYLPNVIEASKAIAITRSERVSGPFGMGVNLVFSDLLRTQTGARFEYTLPYTVEHVYDVQTSADTFGVAWYFNLIGTLGADDLKAE